MTSTSTRLAYVNGRILPETEATVSIRDMGLVYGDSVFDTARTFNGKVFMLGAHIDRLFESLDYARIDPGMDKTAYMQTTDDLLERNLPMLRDGEDYWVTIRVTSGQQALDGETSLQAGSTIVIDCIPIPLRARASFFVNGIEAVVSDRLRIAPEALSPRAKTSNYLNMILAQKEVSAEHPGSWALMCDREGNLAEGAGCNFFIVRDGVVYTPTTEFILTGVSRQVVIELCEELGIPLHESNVSLEQALCADEAFFTSTSLCACPVASVNGSTYGAGIPGPVSQRIMDGFAARVGMDYVAQYKRFLSTNTASTGL
jgi:branched-chain amino acid aminotransferase